MELKDVSLSDISWLIGCVDNAFDDDLAECVYQSDLDVLETIVNTVAATTHEHDDFYYQSFKKRIAAYRQAIQDVEKERELWS